MDTNSFPFLALQFFNLLLAALTVGAMFGLCLSLNPADLSPGVYVVQQQNAIRGYNSRMPLLGLSTAILTLVAAIAVRGNGPRFSMLLIATGCFVAAGLITRFCNQPINSVVMTWSPAEPPANWAQLRDVWWRWHLLRTGIALGGLCVLIAATLDHACHP